MRPGPDDAKRPDPAHDQLAFSPPLTLADDHLDLLTEAVRGALDAAG